MTFIVGKKQDGKTYYYLAESARVEGKPRIVSQRYLGSAEEIAARLSEAGPGEPDRSRHLAFGDVAAVWELLGRLRVAEIVNEVVGARRSDAGASVGTYITLATLNRVVDPCSKLAFSDWWDKTACDRWLRLSPGALDHRRFWEAMDAIDEARLQEIERRIVSAMVETFSIDLSGLVLDMTNFATWIDSANGRAPIAKRGHSKQKRSDLRIVGLGLVVSTDGGIPLVSRAYPGNKPDVTQFGAIVGELVARFATLLPDGADSDGARLTLVYDAGQNSDDNYKTLDGAPLHFVGSLPPSDHPELLAVSKDHYGLVDQVRFPGLVAFEARKAVFGAERRLVVCRSDGLRAKQSRGFDQAELRLSFATDDKARAALEEELFGKRILFSDKTAEQTTTAQIVAEYRSQESVEGDFRQMKDPRVVSFSPMFHFTEQKIRVHVLYCVLALTVARLMMRQAGQAGLHLSVRALLSTLAGIQETVLLYQGERGRPRARRMLTEKDATQSRLYELFELERYAPKR